MILFVDTETTGLPDYGKEPEADGQPYPVQIAAILLDAKFAVRAEINYLIRPEGYQIDNNCQAVKVNHITHEIALQYGFPILDVMVAFNYLCRRATTIVAHNLKFDGYIIGKGYGMAGIASAVPEEKYCTMFEMAKIMTNGKADRIGFSKAYEYAFKEKLVGAHDAMNDVRGVVRLYKWLKQGMSDSTKTEPEIEPSDALEFDHDTLMPFGKHKGIRLRNVPVPYLRWLKGEGCNNPLLQNYLKKQKDI